MGSKTVGGVERISVHKVKRFCTKVNKTLSKSPYISNASFCSFATHIQTCFARHITMFCYTYNHDDFKPCDWSSRFMKVISPGLSSDKQKFTHFYQYVASLTMNFFLWSLQLLRQNLHQCHQETLPKQVIRQGCHLSLC